MAGNAYPVAVTTTGIRLPLDKDKGELGIGNIGNFSHSANYAMGVFNYKNGVSSSADYRTWMSSVTITFNASFSNNIYGNSETVQPPAYYE